MRIVILFVCVLTKTVTSEADPCQTQTQFLPDSEEGQRSPYYQTPAHQNRLCDRFLDEGWYRVNSIAGDDIVTSCVQEYGCGTRYPLWMNSTLPTENDGIVDRTVCLSTHNSCCDMLGDIRVRNCGQYFLYYLGQAIDISCDFAYCFGSLLPCGNGESSETGYEPNCSNNYPQEEYTTTVLPELLEEESEDEAGTVTRALTFKCVLNPQPSNNRLYDVKWHIEGETFVVFTDMSAVDLTTQGVFHEKHWNQREQKIGFFVGCLVRTRFRAGETPSPWQLGTTFFAGARRKDGSPQTLTLDEGDRGLFDFELTVPFGCPTNNANPNPDCHLPFDVAIARAGVGSNDACDTDLTLKKRCGISFETEWPQSSSVQLNVKAFANDILDSATRVRYITLKVPEVFVQHEIWNNYALPTMTIVIRDSEDRTSTWMCQCNNDPHMLSVDGKPYEFHRTGEYVLYRNTETNVQINAIFISCGKLYGRYHSATCNCGVAIRIWNSMFVVNMCGGNVADIQSRVNKYIEYTACEDGMMEFSWDHKDNSILKVKLASGLMVRIRISRVMEWIHIQPSVVDRQQIEGMCSETHVTNILNDWKVSPGNSYFSGEVKLTSIQSDNWCDCGRNGPLTCGLDSSNNVCIRNVEMNDVQPVRGVCGYTRSSPSSSDDVIQREPIEFPDDSSAIEPQWGDLGWTESEARNHCDAAFAEIGNAVAMCGKYADINPDQSINNCMQDIRLTGSTTWTATQVDSFKAHCTGIVSRNQTLNETNSDVHGKSVLDTILETTCPRDCSGNGQCVQGKCYCRTGYIGSDCSGNIAVPPEIIGLPVGHLCNKAERPCNRFQIYVDWTHQSPVCRIGYFELTTEDGRVSSSDVTQVNGVRRLGEEILCELPEERKRRAAKEGVLANGVTISIGYDGQHFSKEYTILIFDGLCVLCDENYVCHSTGKCPDLHLEVHVKSNAVPIGVIVGSVAGILALIVACVAVAIFVRGKKTKVASQSGRLQKEEKTVRPPQLPPPYSAFEHNA